MRTAPRAWHAKLAARRARAFGYSCIQNYRCCRFHHFAAGMLYGVFSALVDGTIKFSPQLCLRNPATFAGSPNYPDRSSAKNGQNLQKAAIPRGSCPMIGISDPADTDGLLPREEQPPRCSRGSSEMACARGSNSDWKFLSLQRNTLRSMLTLHVLAYKNVHIDGMATTAITSPERGAIEGSPPSRHVAKGGRNPASRPGITLEEQGGMQ